MKKIQFIEFSASVQSLTIAASWPNTLKKGNTVNKLAALRLIEKQFHCL